MRLTRRRFLLAVPAAFGFLKFGGAAFGQRRRKDGLFTIPATGDRLSELDWNSFLPYQYSDFEFTKGDATYILRLAELKDSAPDGFIGKGEHPCFELHFQSSSITPIEQGIYRVGHFALGSFDLFVTSGGRKGRSSYAIAIINRLLG